MTVLSGGSATSETISGSGAVLDLLSGAVGGGGIIFSGSGGEVQVGGAPPSIPIVGIPISGFTLSGDVIDLTVLAFSGTSVVFNSASDTLTVVEGAGSATIQLDTLENYTGVSWRRKAMAPPAPTLW
jgi:hypothetical protein